MADKDIYIQEQAELDASLIFLSNAFYLDKTLPEQVFRENFTEFQIDQDWIACSVFWEALQKSTLNQGDELITVIAMNYEGIVAQVDGHYNAFKLSLNDPPSIYWQLISGAMSDEIVIMVVPESLNWAIRQDIDFELTIIAFNKTTGADKIPLQSDWFPFEDNWMSMETAVTDLMPQMYREGKVPDDTAAEFCQNYGNQ